MDFYINKVYCNNDGNDCIIKNISHPIDINLIDNRLYYSNQYIDEDGNILTVYHRVLSDKIYHDYKRNNHTIVLYYEIKYNNVIDRFVEIDKLSETFPETASILKLDLY